MKELQLVKQNLLNALGWEEAHANTKNALAKLPFAASGKTTGNLPYSCWQLIEHIRLVQEDIIDFCINPNYKKRNWPDDFWPKLVSPENEDCLQKGILAIETDRQKLVDYINDADLSLLATIPHGSGQTYLRECILLVDHSSYHIGQLVLIRKLLGVWE